MCRNNSVGMERSGMTWPLRRPRRRKAFRTKKRKQAYAVLPFLFLL
jgi:hypothetical protein